MSYETIRVESRFDGRVCEITLGPGPANIVTGRLMDELSSALGTQLGEKSTRLVVIGGEGKHFSYGASVEEHRADAIREVLPRFHELVGQMMSYPVPTLAKVSGLCLGGGFEVALACSMIFADGGARFGVPEIKLGVFPPVAAVLLPQAAGNAAASRIVLSGEMISAQAARDIGIVTTLSPYGELDATVDAFVKEHNLPKSASSLRFTNRVARRALAEHYKTYIADAEKLYLDDLMSSADANEGIDAFLAKREPEWKDE